jgi:hypothetical protein
MEVARYARSARLVVIALVALLGLAVVAGGSGAAASGPGHAVAAKKKCKKKKKGVQSAKKKKKCRKHVLTIPGPIVRATISWPAGEVDLHAFDSAGNRSGIAFPCSTNPCPIAEGIPNATHSPDSNNGGTETFTDNIFVRNGTSNREFAYVICYYTSTTVTFTGVNRFGQSQTLSIPDTAGSGQNVTATGGPSVPASFGCPS